jgi:hypothetical protein
MWIFLAKTALKVAILSFVIWLALWVIGFEPQRMTALVVLYLAVWSVEFAAKLYRVTDAIFPLIQKREQAEFSKAVRDLIYSTGNQSSQERQD